MVSWLLIAALLVTLIGGLWLVLWRRALAGVGYLSAWSITALMLAGQGPGGDILLPSESLGAAPGGAGVVWLNLGMVCALLPLLVLVPFGRKRRNRRIPSGAPRQDRENPHYS